MAKKKPFGGMTVRFKGDKETMEKVFGSTPLTPSSMTKKLWVHIKRKRLMKR